MSPDRSGDRELSALLPLKISGRHYGDNLARLDLLFSSLTHYGAPGWLGELLVVARADELDLVARYLAHWPELPLRIVVEDEHFPAFRRFTRPWQVRPWQRQQIIKLNAAALTTSPFVLTLDPDVIAVKPITRELLLPHGRALLEPEARSVHRRWWRDSADLLGVEPRLEQPGMNVSPALLSTVVLNEVQRRLEAIGGRPWMDVLLTSYCDWTEYTLYLLAAEQADAVNRYHLWADAPQAPAHVHTRPDFSIWDSATASREHLERLFTSEDPGLFAVVQSNSGLAPSEVAAVAENHFAVRSIRTGGQISQGPRAKLRERSRVATRIVAQGVYRIRRALGRRKRRSPHSAGAAPVAGGADRVASEVARR
ncbi:MAG TPA: DUF6492 family protein [Solirubrobacterales bacterium]